MMKTLEECKSQLNGRDETRRACAAEELGYLNDSRGVSFLLDRVYRESSLLVRDAIVQALIRIDGEESILAAINLLTSPAPQTKNLGAFILQHKRDAAVPYLQAVMRDGRGQTRKLILDVLSGAKVAGAEQFYLAALSDSETDVVISAVENIGRYHIGLLRGEVEKVLAGANQAALEIACLNTLAEIGNEQSLQTAKLHFPDPDTLPALLLTPYLNVLATLGGERERAEISLLVSKRGYQSRPTMLTSLQNLAAALKREEVRAQRDQTVNK